jgi:hypothetical protein
MCECEGKSYFDWIFPFYPSGSSRFEWNELNGVGKEIVYNSPSYPNGMFEWLPWDDIWRQKSFALDMDMEVSLQRKRKREEEEERKTSKRLRKKK